MLCYPFSRLWGNEVGFGNVEISSRTCYMWAIRVVGCERDTSWEQDVVDSSKHQGFMIVFRRINVGWERKGDEASSLRMQIRVKKSSSKDSNAFLRLGISRWG